VITKVTFTWICGEGV